jgi:hypothetical protein
MTDAPTIHLVGLLPRTPAARPDACLCCAATRADTNRTAFACGADISSMAGVTRHHADCGAVNQNPRLALAALAARLRVDGLYDNARAIQSLAGNRETTTPLGVLWVGTDDVLYPPPACPHCDAPLITQDAYDHTPTYECGWELSSETGRFDVYKACARARRALLIAGVRQVWAAHAARDAQRPVVLDLLAEIGD